MKILVAGQGLAGTVISFELQQRGHEVTVMDGQQEPAASRVAAGMWNPVSFRRVIPTWRAHQLIPKMHFLYAQMEQFLNIQVVHKMPVVRIFPNQEYAGIWEKALQTEVATFLAPAKNKTLSKHIHAPYGHGEVSEAGYVDLPLLLDSWRVYLIENGRLLNQQWTGNARWNEKGAEVEGVQYDAVVLCLGTGAAHDPLTANWEFLRQNKGEVLTLKIPGLKLDHVLNKGKWLLPVGEESFRLGSSYEWQQTERIPSPGVREQFLDVLKEMLPDVKPEIVEHQIGVRPTVKDRRPVVGAHPNQKNAWIFNGLGTRGVMLAPFCAAYLADLLEKKVAPDPELMAQRFRI